MKRSSSKSASFWSLTCPLTEKTGVWFVIWIDGEAPSDFADLVIIASSSTGLIVQAEPIISACPSSSAATIKDLPPVTWTSPSSPCWVTTLNSPSVATIIEVALLRIPGSFSKSLTTETWLVCRGTPIKFNPRRSWIWLRPWLPNSLPLIGNTMRRFITVIIPVSSATGLSALVFRLWSPR